MKMSCWISCLVLVLLMFVASAAEGRVQRMRVHSGTYRINGAVASAAARTAQMNQRRVEISATCVDLDFEIPGPENLFTARTSGIRVLDSKGNPVSDENVKKWFEFKGNDDFSSIGVELTSDAPKEQFDIVVSAERPQILGFDSAEVIEMSARLQPFEAMIREADELVGLVDDVFGGDSILAEAAKYLRQKIDWDFGAVRDQSLPTIISLKTAIVDEVRSIYGIRADARVSQGMISLLARKAFDKSKLAKLCERLGVDLSDNLSDAAVIWRTEKEFGITDTEGNVEINADLSIVAKKAAKRGVLVSDMRFTADEAKTLRDSGVHVVASYSHVTRQSKQPPGIIVVASRHNDEAINKKIFEDQPVGGIESSLVGLEKLNEIRPGYVKRVETQAEFEEVLNKFPAGETPIVVCHNARDGIQFEDARMDFEEIRRRVDLLTCNTYELGSLGLRTTGYLNFKTMCASLHDAVRPGLLHGGDDPPPGGGGGWPGGFGSNYGKKEGNNALFFLGALSSGGIALVLVTDDDDDDQPEPPPPPTKSDPQNSIK